jgi:hypothetical protein
MYSNLTSKKEHGMRESKIVLMAAIAAALTTGVTFTISVNDSFAAGAEVRDHRHPITDVVRDHRKTVTRDQRGLNPPSNATAPKVKSGLQQFKDKVGKTSAGKNLFDRPTPAAASASPSSATSNATAPKVKSGLQQFKDKVGKTSAGKNLFDRPTPAAASAPPASAPPAAAPPVAALPPTARPDEKIRDHREPKVTTRIETDHRAGQDNTTYQITTIQYPNGKTVIRKKAVKKKKEERDTPCSSWPFCF